MKPTQEQALDWAFECDFVESSPAEDVFSAIYVCCPKDIERLVILAYDAGRAALAQPEQEPVAWLYRTNNTWDHVSFVEPPDDAYDEGSLLPVYTAKPQREWVGLTDEELLDIADMAYANDLELLQTLQAKLKEKNT